MTWFYSEIDPSQKTQETSWQRLYCVKACLRYFAVTSVFWKHPGCKSIHLKENFVMEPVKTLHFFVQEKISQKTKNIYIERGVCKLPMQK